MTENSVQRDRAEDTATILMRHTSGAVSVVEASYAAKRRDDAFPETMLEIEGEGGSVYASRPRPNERQQEQEVNREGRDGLLFASPLFLRYRKREKGEIGEKKTNLNTV